MSNPTHDRGAALRVLSTDECTDLLRRHQLGRLSLEIDEWPAILPVNYLFDGSAIVIRTAPGGKLANTPISRVAFEIDDADRYGKWGWSVLVQGPAVDITDADDPASTQLRKLPVYPWAPGAKDHSIKIELARISGRSFGQPPVE
jgi:nitroimidazol reductase NimA-like FMN-containing flavoprotein (pyridoxamine 5'-phosphate oxidase superfamily)